ncbi:hypothetical protein K435DRAFT_965519 [Dendrothele bispora CBS 962.96]|uniref:Uncharacterized protein n=1 Tax=Dendrothele bispora (strain CBS 962.96) TaxID=1314807 RepID=A0A4S8M5C9_DENBC|nr:hypothetical protein K435DRAFT_965519 [Dendrothele bispora CBS 962.96]
MDRIRYSLVSRQENRVVSSYNRRTFHIRKLLYRYLDTISDIAQFRSLQYQTGMLISGYAAVQFFDNTVCPGSGLDVFVEIGRVEPVAKFLMEKGFVFEPDQDQLGGFEQESSMVKVLRTGNNDVHQLPVPPNLNLWNIQHPKNLAEIFNFVKDGKRIQISTCLKTPMAVILNFHSTCVMNIISHSHAYSFYPYETFEEGVEISIFAQWQLERDNHCATCEKYTGKGWRMISKPSAKAYFRPNSEFRNDARFVGDSGCWTIPLEPFHDQNEVVSSEHQALHISMHAKDDIVRANGWRNDVNGIGELMIFFDILSSGSLEHQYTIPWFSHPIITDGLDDRQLIGRMHDWCRAANAGSISQPQEDVKSRAEKVFYNALMSARFPCENNLEYSSYPDVETGRPLLDVLTKLFRILEHDPEVEISFLPYSWPDDDAKWLRRIRRPKLSRGIITNVKVFPSPHVFPSKDSIEKFMYWSAQRSLKNLGVDLTVSMSEYTCTLWGD